MFSIAPSKALLFVLLASAPDVHVLTPRDPVLRIWDVDYICREWASKILVLPLLFKGCIKPLLVAIDVANFISTSSHFVLINSPCISLTNCKISAMEMRLLRTSATILDLHSSLSFYNASISISRNFNFNFNFRNHEESGC